MSSFLLDVYLNLTGFPKENVRNPFISYTIPRVSSVHVQAFFPAGHCPFHPKRKHTRKLNGAPSKANTFHKQKAQEISRSDDTISLQRRASSLSIPCLRPQSNSLKLKNYNLGRVK